MNINILDKRYNNTKYYILTHNGSPTYKKRAFTFIDKVLGPQYKWINIPTFIYFNQDAKLEAKQAIKILNFTGKESFKEVRNKYINLSKTWHPDCGGHASAFDILNHAYNLFKDIYEEEISHRSL